MIPTPPAGSSIIRLPLGPYQVNTYVVKCQGTGMAAIIDPAGGPEAILATLEQENAVAAFILNTHGHPDHLLANAALRATLSVPVCMHGEDSGFYHDDPQIEALQRETGLTVDTVADRRLVHDEALPLGRLSIRVLHTPGHTPGSCCYLVAGDLFTGDTLFVGDAGRTDLKGGSLKRLIHSIETRLLNLSDEIRIWPGHDYGERPTSTIGQEKRENPYITDFIIDP